METQSNPQIEQNADRLDPPPGFTVVRGPDSRDYLVPHYMVPSLQLAFAAQDNRRKLEADAAAAGPRETGEEHFEPIAAGDIEYPVVPFLSDREASIMHAEVLAMQSRWGISYKDAAHRLYLAELEKMKVDKEAENAMIRIREEIDRITTHEINPVINYIDREAK